MGNDRSRTREGDEKLAALFDKFHGRLVSPGGAAALLGVSRKTVHMLGKRGEVRVFASDDEDQWGPFKFGPRWVYVPTEDVYAYARRTGRETEALKRWPGWLGTEEEEAAGE
jgi:hypothetical protein